jgi:hypothetical protein
VQCMQAIDTERSPGLPSLMVTTRRRLMPHGTSFSFLQAVTHALHPMQRSASQRNFIRAMIVCPHAAPSQLFEHGHGEFGIAVLDLGALRVGTFGEEVDTVALNAESRTEGAPAFLDRMGLPGCFNSGVPQDGHGRP